MKNFDFGRYIIRVVKYFIYLVVFLALILALFFALSDQPTDIGSLFKNGVIDPTGFIFLIAIAIIYPFFGYTTAKTYLTKPFRDNQEQIEKVFFENRFVIVDKTDTTIIFRHRSAFTRLLRMFEDNIVLDFSDNPILLSGLRRDVYRLARTIQYAVREKE